MGRNSRLPYFTTVEAAFFLMVMSIPVLGASPPPSKGPADVLKDRVDRGDLSALKEIAALPPDEAIRALRPYSRRGVWSGPHPEPPGVHDESIRLITQIPGHAEYSAKVIEASRSLPPDKYDTRRINEFHMLSTYGSEEALDVLGRYLSDPTPQQEPIDPKHPEDWQPRSSNAVMSALALRRINLPDAPPKQTRGRKGQIEVELFQKWWAARQEKKQSANIPATKGSVRSAAPPASKTTVPQASLDEAAITTSSPMKWMAWLALALAAIGLLWLMFKKRG
jgi:hypothetical protein